MAQSSDNDPYPVLSVGTDGTVLYSNAAGELLLHEWGTAVGQKLPPYFVDVVKGATSIKAPQKIEVKTENSIYLVSFHPLPEQECVNIYGFDISDYKETEVRLREAHEQMQIQSEELNVANEELRVQSDELAEANVILHDSVTGFRALAENSPDLIARFDRQNHCLYANPAITEISDIPLVAEFYGWSLNEFSKKTNLEAYIDPEMVKFSEKQFANVFTTGEPEAMELHYTSSQGKEYYFDTKIVPEFYCGKVVSVLSISRDITNIKEAEIKLNETLDSLEETVEERTADLKEAYDLLKESESSFAEAQRMAHIGNWKWDAATDKTHWSEEMYRIFGLSTQELAPCFNQFLNYIHPDDRDCMDKIINKRSEGLFDVIDYRIILANGEERTVYIRAEAIFNGSIPIRVKGIVQDITERKKAEEKIQILANIVESSNDAIITESLDGIITSWNKGAEKVYGYLAEEVIGKNLSILEPDNLKGETKQLADEIRQEEKIQHYETLRLKKDGTNINVSITLSPILYASGKFVAISCIDRDITEKKIAEKLLQEKHMAEAANRTKSDFLANISHELRTPLNSIIGFSDMLHEQAYGELNKRQLKSVGNISKSGKHLLNLINNILDISKIEAGKMELNYKDFELATQLNMIRNILLHIADKKNIKIEIDIDSNLSRIHADEDKFVQIMYNLLDNAIKFSYENSIVKIEVRKKGDLVEITVKDTGIGIKVEDQYKLFKPFSQIDSFFSKKSQGTGLGLSLVKQIVHLHGGYIWFRSNPSTGSTFAFVIPVNNKGNSG
jgi:PAS domain S-box-containing protein